MAIQSIKKLEDYSPAPAGANQQIQYNNNGVLGASSNMTFDVNGTLSLFNSSPSSYIDSTRGLIIGSTSDASAEIVIATNTTGIGELNFTDTADTTNQGQILYDHTSNYMSFNTNGSERMRVDTNGRFLFGATSWNGQGRVESTGDANNGCFYGTAAADQTLDYRYSSATNFSSYCYYANVNRANSSLYEFLRCNNTDGASLLLRGDGNAYADAAWNGSGADYQEYFESQSGVAAEVGRAVVLDGDQIRYYNAATDSVDDIMGVTRPEAENKNSAVVGNLAWNFWTDKYLTDDYGVYLREDITIYRWFVEGIAHTVHQHANLWLYSRGGDLEYVSVGSVTIPADAVQTTDNVRKLNPAFDPAQEANYKSREDRDEWWLIGLLGQIQIKAGEPTNPRWIKMKNISEEVELWFVR